MRSCLAPGVLKQAYKTALIIFALVCFHAVALGGTTGDKQDLFTGFEDPLFDPEPSTPPETSFFDHFSGYTKFFTVANTTHYSPGPEYRNWHGLSGLRLETMLEGDFRIANWKTFASIKGFYDFAYALNGRKGYTAEVLDTYEKEIDLWEVYLQRSLTDFIDVKIGRQIVAWGRSDNFRVTDILNPLDNRDPGIVDIENLRLPLAMIKVDLFLDNWNLDLISIHEHQYDQNPSFGHFFYPSATPLPSEEVPAHTLTNTELAAALTGTFRGWDLSFYGAHIFNDQPTFIPANLEHQKISMIGAGLSIARGDMLYIAELAHLRGLRFLDDYEREYNRSDLLVGIEYSGWTDTTISLDYVSRRLHDYDAILVNSPENPQHTDNGIACRIISDFMQDTLQLTALLILNGVRGQYGALQRFTARYDIVDNWSVTGGLLLFQARNGPMASVGDTGRVFCELRYDF